MEPLVSIIVPVYNVSLYFQEALESIISQTYQNLEILLVDDGSTDGSSSLCDEYQQKDSRIQVIHQENRGLSGARNTGLNHMTGELVAFLDPDDAYKPEMIDQMVKAIQNSNADIVVCGYSIHKTENCLMTEQPQKRFCPEKGEVLCRQEALTALIKGVINHSVWNKIYRKELWSTLRFPEGMVFEDVCTTYQLLDGSEKVILIPEILLMYRIRSGSITKTPSRKMFSDWIKASEQYEKFIQLNIPEVYSEQDYQLFKTRRLCKLIARWKRMIKKYPDIAEDIRKEIRKKGKEVNFFLFPVKIRVTYRMICFCPKLIQAIRVGHQWVKKHMKTA